MYNTQVSTLLISYHFITAPALSSIKNERVVFSSAFGIEQSPFQGKPTEENNKLWASLYDCESSLFIREKQIPTILVVGISRISADEARPMDNKTLPIADTSGGYIVQLSVFHQLHCLVSISSSNRRL